MAFINDNQVKMGRRKKPVPIVPLPIINRIQNRRIGGENNPCILIVLIASQNAERHPGQILPD